MPRSVLLSVISTFDRNIRRKRQRCTASSSCFLVARVDRGGEPGADPEPAGMSWRDCVQPKTHTDGAQVPSRPPPPRRAGRDLEVEVSEPVDGRRLAEVLGEGLVADQLEVGRGRPPR